MKTKVCHFSSVHHVWDTRVFYRECVSLAKVYDVTLIAIGEGSLIKNGVKIIGIKKPSSVFIRFFITIFKVFIEAVKVDARIYHIHDAEMIPFGIALRILGKQVIYDIHENTYDDILLKPWLNKSIRKFIAGVYNILLYFGSKFMHYIVVLAEPSFLPRFFVKEKDCTIIQNFADTDELGDYSVPDRAALPGNHLFYIGMIRDMYYNIDPVLEALNLLRQRGVICQLHLIGYFGSGKNEKFDNLPFWNDIKDLVKLYGFLQMKDAYNVSKQCKIGICIKNQPEQMLVSHERKLFEYIAIGLPSLFCNSSIYTSLNEKYHIGVSTDLNDPVQIAKSLEKLLENPVLLNQLSQNNLNAGKGKFNWKSEEIKILELYAKLAA